MPLLASFLFVLCTSGCASVAPSAEGPMPEGYYSQQGSGMALITFIRPSNISGSANDFRISANGSRILDLPNGRCFQFMAQPGELLISAAVVRTVINTGLLSLAQKQSDLQIDLQAGDSPYILVKIGSLGDPVLEKINGEAGRSMVGGLRSLGLYRRADREK